MPQNGQLKAKKRDQSGNRLHLRHHCIHSTASSPPTIPDTPSLDHHACHGGRRERRRRPEASSRADRNDLNSPRPAPIWVLPLSAIGIDLGKPQLAVPLSPHQRGLYGLEVTKYVHTQEGDDLAGRFGAGGSEPLTQRPLWIASAAPNESFPTK